MQDAWRAYLELALGVTEASKKKAQKAARRLAGRGGATAVQLQTMAEDLVTTSVANREALTKLVRYEVDRALGVVGLATAEEVGELTKRVHDLEHQLEEAEARAAAATLAALSAEAAPVDVPAPAAARTAATTPVAQKSVAKKAVAKKAVAKKAVAKRTVAKKAVVPPPPVKAGPAKAAPAGAGVEKVAKKAVAKKAVAKKVAPPAAPLDGETQA